MIKKSARTFSLILCATLLLTLSSPKIINAGAVADAFDIKDDLGGFVTDNTFDFVSGKLSDFGEATGQLYNNVANNEVVKTYRPERSAELIKSGGRLQGLSNTLRGAGFILNVYNTGNDTYKLFTETSKQETTAEKAIDKGLLAIDVGMGWYAVGVGTIAIITAPAWGTGVAAAAAATGTTYLVTKLGVGLTRVAFNSETYRSVSRFVRGKSKLTLSIFERPGTKEGLDIIREEFGFDLYPGLRREIPDPSTGIAVYKPNIYLYSDTDMDAVVYLYPSHWITVSDPVYNEDTGWYASVIDGSLNGSEDYLFYEAIVPPDSFQTERGWHVMAGSLEKDMANILKLYDFNETETNDFLDYWTRMLDGKTSYTFYPQHNDTLDILMPVITYPSPDKSYRVWFYILPYDEDAKEPELPEKIVREKFTLVEWGGILP